jgi:hypothetical protein
VFNVTPDATTEGFVFDLLDNPNIDTGIDVSAELADIDTVVDASGITLRLGAMSPSFEEGKAIVHQLLKRENAIRSMIGANRGDVVVMDGVKFTINLPAFYTRKKVALTVSDTVKFNFFIDQSPAQALNPAFVVNPFDTNGRVEIDANPAALDPSTLAAAVVDALPEGTTGLTAQEVWEYATRTLTSGGGGGDDAATVYAYFTDATRPDAFKADVSALATAASVSALNDVSSVDVQAAATAALAAYDPPTRAEATADKDAIIAALPTAAPDAATVATAVRSELTTELGLIDVAVSTRATNAGVWAETSRTVTGVSGIDLAALHKTIQATTGRAVTAPDDLSTVVYDSDNATALLTFTHSADGRERTPS